MKPFNNILVATDTRLDIHPIVDHATRMTQRNGATLKLVDFVPEFPWIARLMAREHGDLQQMLTTEKQANLDALAATIRKKHIEVNCSVLAVRREPDEASVVSSRLAATDTCGSPDRVTEL